MSTNGGGPDTFEQYRRLVESLPSGTAGSVELVARQLSATAESLLRLTAIPHSFDLSIAQVLMPEAEPELLQRALTDELLPLSFVVGDSDGFVLHDDVRRYLFRTWLETYGRDADRWARFQAASGRLADLYAARAEELVGEAQAVAHRQRIYHLVGADPQRGFEAFQQLCNAERYRYCLESCGALIALMQEYEPILTTASRDWLDYQETKLLLDQHRYAEAKHKLEQMWQRDSVKGDPALYARCLYRSAAAARGEHDAERASEIYAELMGYASAQPAANDLMMRAMQGYGSLLVEMGRADEAQKILNAAKALAEESGNNAALATVWNTIGILHRRLAQPHRALEAFGNALREIELGQEIYRQRQVYNNIGLLYADQAQWPQARDNLEKSGDIARKAGDSDGEATSLSNLVRVYLNLSQISQALTAAERAIKLFQSVHNWNGAAMTSRGLARYYRRADRIPEARAALVRAADMFDRAGLPDRAAETEREIQQLDSPKRRWGCLVIGLAGLGVIVCLLLLVAIFVAAADL